MPFAKIVQQPQIVERPPGMPPMMPLQLPEQRGRDEDSGSQTERNPHDTLRQQEEEDPDWQEEEDPHSGNETDHPEDDTLRQREEQEPEVQERDEVSGSHTASPAHSPARNALTWGVADGIARQLFDFWDQRGEQLPQRANALRELLFAKTKHPIPRDLWIPDAAQPGEQQYVTAVVSEEYVLLALKEVIQLRETWLQQNGLPLDFQMRDKLERPKFLAYAKKLYHAEAFQLDKQDEDRKQGGSNKVASGKHSRWSRELQRRLGTAQLWHAVSFTGRVDEELLTSMASGPVAAPQRDAEQANRQHDLTRTAHKARSWLRWGEHLARRRAAGRRNWSESDQDTLAKLDSGRLRMDSNDATKASGFGRVKLKDGPYVDIGPNTGGLTRTILDDFVPAAIAPESDDDDI